MISDFIRRLLMLPEQASTISTDIDGLHFFVILATMIGSAAVFLVALYFLIRYKRKDRPGATPYVRFTASMEAVWIGGLLFLFILWWVIGYNQFIRVRQPPEDAMEVYVQGKQWMWKFAYPDGRNAIARLTVPVDTDVRLNMTSRDVIHSFFVPAFRVKQDVLPGRYTSLWFRATKVGEYPILCTEYCGLAHSGMRGVVSVLSAPDFERWLQGGATQGDAVVDGVRRADALDRFRFARGMPEQTFEVPADRTMAEQGRRAATRHGCFACHTVDGTRHIGPTWQGLYRATIELTDGRTAIADEEYLTESMMDPLARITAGFAPVMPSYWGVLDAAESAAIVEFIKTLRGPRTDVVFPALPVEDFGNRPPEAAPEGEEEVGD